MYSGANFAGGAMERLADRLASLGIAVGPTILLVGMLVDPEPRISYAGLIGVGALMGYFPFVAAIPLVVILGAKAAATFPPMAGTAPEVDKITPAARKGFVLFSFVMVAYGLSAQVLLRSGNYDLFIVGLNSSIWLLFMYMNTIISSEMFPARSPMPSSVQLLRAAPYIQAEVAFAIPRFKSC